MFELVLRAPAAVVEPLSDLLMDEVEALVRLVSKTPMPTPHAEHALFGEPGMPAPAAGWDALDPESACSTPSWRPNKPPWLVLARRWRQMASMCRRLQHAGRPGLGAVDASRSLRRWRSRPPSGWYPAGTKRQRRQLQVIRLDPGLAFGTGTHPTTRMCLRWLATHPATGGGAGVCWTTAAAAGILAIGAALVGAAHDRRRGHRPGCRAVHPRPTPLHNGVAEAQRLRTPAGPMGWPASRRTCYGVVLANILATPLERCWRRCWPAMWQPGGWLVMAGILERQADELKARLTRPGCNVQCGRLRRRLDSDVRRNAAWPPETPTASTTWQPAWPPAAAPAAPSFASFQDQLRVSEGLGALRPLCRGVQRQPKA